MKYTAGGYTMHFDASWMEVSQVLRPAPPFDADYKDETDDDGDDEEPEG